MTTSEKAFEWVTLPGPDGMSVEIAHPDARTTVAILRHAEMDTVQMDSTAVQVFGALFAAAPLGS